MTLPKYVVEEIRKRGLDDRAYARGDSGAGNKEKTDITTSMLVLGQPPGMECKRAKAYKMSEWWPQTRKLESLGYDPTLIYKLDNERFESTKVVIYLSTYLDLAKEALGIEVTQSIETPKVRKALHYVENAKLSLRSAAKELE